VQLRKNEIAPFLANNECFWLYVFRLINVLCITGNSNDRVMFIHWETDTYNVFNEFQHNIFKFGMNIILLL